MSDSNRAAWANAQAGCLGSVLQAPDLTGQLLSETSAQDFDGPGLIVYQAIARLFAAAKPVDPILVAELLPDDSHREYMLQTIDLTPSTAMLPDYIKAVKRRSRVAQVRRMLQDALASETLDDLQRQVSLAQEALTEDRGNRTLNMSEGMTAVMDQLREGREYFPTGMRPLDSTVFISAGKYVVLAGRPSSGKTALAIQLAISQARTYRVGFYSLEGADEVHERALIQKSKVSSERFLRAQLTEQELSAVAQASMDLVQYHSGFQVTNAAGWTVEQIFANAWAQHRQIIYIDHLQLCRSGTDSRSGSQYELITRVSNQIRNLSQSYGLLVFALCQLNRESEKSATPSMSSVRDSGAIEQDADIMMLLTLQEASRPSGPRNLTVVKNKRGGRVKIGLAFDPSTMTFSPLSTRQPPPLPRYRSLKDSTPVPEQWEQTEIGGSTDAQSH